MLKVPDIAADIQTDFLLRIYRTDLKENAISTLNAGRPFYSISHDTVL